MKALLTQIPIYGASRLCVCDHRCEKAWGINGRRADMSTMVEYNPDGDPDDIMYLPDDQVGRAPDDPGTYEGISDGAKPMHPTYHNRWCARECERSSIIDPGQEIEFTDYSYPVFNIPEKHDTENHSISLDRVFEPVAGNDIKGWIEEFEV